MSEVAQITELPREILGDILMHLARLDYDSLYSLEAVSRFFRDLIQNFMKLNPRSKFAKPVVGRPAGYSDSELSDFDSWNDVNEVADDRDIPDIDDLLERLSFGSNLDEEQLDAYLDEANPASELLDQGAVSELTGGAYYADDEW